MEICTSSLIAQTPYRAGADSCQVIDRPRANKPVIKIGTKKYNDTINLETIRLSERSSVGLVTNEENAAKNPSETKNV
jgi:hypothetical protein